MRPPRTLSLPLPIRRPLAAATLLLLLAAGCKSKPKSSTGKPIAAPNTAEFADALNPLLGQPRLPSLQYPGLGAYAQPLNDFYRNRDLQIAWSHDGKPGSQALALIHAFSEADSLGLRPADYDAAPDNNRWPARVEALRSRSHAAVADFDLALTVCAMRFLTDVHSGRVPPSHFSFEIDRASKALPFPGFLNDRVIDSGDIPGLIHSLEPDSDDYRRTLAALHQYQALAKQQGDSPEELPPPSGQLGPGSHYPRLADLRARLALEGYGDPPDPDAKPSNTLTEADSDAVKDYQAHHGFTPDGKLGPATVRSLNVPMSTRVTQLIDSLERWRWLPDPYLKPRLLVNLPEFLLRGYSPTETGHQLEWNMRIVDGKAKGNHDTPVFTHMMKYLVFRPYWNVPISIIKKELVGHVSASPTYLEDKGYEVLNRTGKPATNVTANGLEHGLFLVRQKPGPTNALGLVKFMFPNQYDIYLHSTPEVGFFSRQRRDFSHGCIRVQHPDQLAAWVLAGQDNPKTHDPWDLDTINEAFNDEDANNKVVGLKTPLPIDVYYLTAFPDEDGKTRFFDDIYDYDTDLNTTLQQGPPYPAKPLPPRVSAPGDTV